MGPSPRPSWHWAQPYLQALARPLALAGDVTHFALGLDLLPRSDASAVDVSDPAAAPAALAEVAPEEEAAPEGEAATGTERGATATAEGGGGEEGEVFPVWEGPAVPPTVPPSPPPSPPSSPPLLQAGAIEGGAARQQGELESVAVTWLACDCEGGDGMLSGVIDLLRGQRGSAVN